MGKIDKTIKTKSINALDDLIKYWSVLTRNRKSNFSTKVFGGGGGMLIKCLPHSLCMAIWRGNKQKFYFDTNQKILQKFMAASTFHSLVTISLG